MVIQLGNLFYHIAHHCIYMYNPRQFCKMQCLHNLVLENFKYLRFYSTFWFVISNSSLKLPKLSIHILILLPKLLQYIKLLFEVPFCISFSAIFATEKVKQKFSSQQLKFNYWSARHQKVVSEACISFKCS